MVTFPRVSRSAAPHFCPSQGLSCPETQTQAQGQPTTFTLPGVGTPTGATVSPNKFLSEKLSGPGK